MTTITIETLMAYKSPELPEGYKPSSIWDDDQEPDEQEQHHDAMADMADRWCKLQQEDKS